ncbi:MAG: metal-dependent transcriptional regulator [Candidatus Gastranaerophilales bacterium]|nr:metal-dependent transcriptional regulator [Candidatus Gastranaerophilales bacterium]
MKDTREKQLTQCLENYLLAIYELVKQNKAARVKDVSTYMKKGAPATSDAIKMLAVKGYINYVPYGIITLTSKGEKKALQKIERHGIICRFLANVLKINEKEVSICAENMEYSMNEIVLEKFVNFLCFMEKCTCKEPKWVKSFEYYDKNGKMQDKCDICSRNKENFDNSKCCGACRTN